MAYNVSISDTASAYFLFSTLLVQL